MAYFPNGTAGMIWEEENCAHCVHDEMDGGCPIMLVHNLFNYDQGDGTEKEQAVESILSFLIPRTPDCTAGPCPMLIHKKPSQADWMDGQDVVPSKEPLMRFAPRSARM